MSGAAFTCSSVTVTWRLSGPIVIAASGAKVRWRPMKPSLTARSTFAAEPSLAGSGLLFVSLLGGGKVDADGFVLAALLDLAALGEGAFVRSRRGLLDHQREAARPEPPRCDDVRLGGEQGDVRGEVEPGEQPDHERERAVDVARILQDVADVVAAERLQDLVEDAGADRAAAQLSPAHLARRQQPEAGPEEADVERGRADLPAEPESGPDRGEAGQDRGRQRAAAE